MGHMEGSSLFSNPTAGKSWSWLGFRSTWFEPKEEAGLGIWVGHGGSQEPCKRWAGSLQTPPAVGAEVREAEGSELGAPGPLSRAVRRGLMTPGEQSSPPGRPDRGGLCGQGWPGKAEDAATVASALLGAEKGGGGGQSEDDAAGDTAGEQLAVERQRDRTAGGRV